MSDSCARQPWLLKKTVLPQHTDHAGVMWHGSYLSFLEEARIKALSEVGLSYGDLSSQGYELPVVELQIKYVEPLFHGDNLVLQSWVSKGKGPRWQWQTKIFKDLKKPAALSVVDLVLIKRVMSGLNLLRKGPEHISKALVDLQKGPDL